MRGHVANVCTDRDARRLGHGRAVFAALMGWFGELGVVRVDLRATTAAESLYRGFGFRDSGGVPLTRAADRD